MYIARQQLIVSASMKRTRNIKVEWKTVFIGALFFQGNLLVTLSFDYSDFSLNKVDIDGLSAKYGVLISWRDKNKQNSKSIAIKGKEKFISELRVCCMGNV